MGEIDTMTLLLGALLGIFICGIAAYTLFVVRSSALRIKVAGLETEAKSDKAALGKAEIQVHTLEAQKQELLGQFHKVQAERNLLIQEREKYLESLQEQSRLAFQDLAQQILDQKSRSFNEAQEQSLGSFLQPFREQLTIFEQKIQANYLKEHEDRGYLKRELQLLHDLNTQLGKEARELTLALKGSNKVQGNWGEQILQRLLEASGLQDGIHYHAQAKQMKLQDEEGNRIQPDIVIQLPEERQIIIDAKVSLIAYMKWTLEEDLGIKEQHLKEHIGSVKNHIKLLSDKHYAQSSRLQTPDFVLMFMPIEPAFSLAISGNEDLIPYAWERKIVLVSTSTLLATLKTIDSLWRIEKQNKNAEQIARQGAELHDKFVTFVVELEKIGSSLEKGLKAYEDAMNRLTSGNGNLISQAEKLRDMGIPAKKSLPKNHLLNQP